MCAQCPGTHNTATVKVVPESRIAFRHAPQTRGSCNTGHWGTPTVTYNKNGKILNLFSHVIPTLILGLLLTSMSQLFCPTPCAGDLPGRGGHCLLPSWSHCHSQLRRFHLPWAAFPSLSHRTFLSLSSGRKLLQFLLLVSLRLQLWSVGVFTCVCWVSHLSYDLTECPGQGHTPGYSVIEQMCIDHWCEPYITLCSENEKQKKTVPGLRKWSPQR